MTEKMARPVVIELDEGEERVSPADAPILPEMGGPVTVSSGERGIRIAAAKMSLIAKLFWAAVSSLIVFMLGVFVWDFAATMLDRNIWLGRGALALLSVIVFALVVVAGKELATLSRLRRIDGLRAKAEALDGSDDLEAAKSFQNQLLRLYHGRADLRWAIAEINERQDEVFDAKLALDITEEKLMRPLDAQARQSIEASARQVATATAIVPLAFADIIVALTANLRMIRQIAQIYGGRSGALGNWRLTKSIATHLVATGAVAVGDDLVGSIAGGGILSKVSRRFGEGVINGALTARVGVAAMEVCRPMPFQAVEKPRVTGLIKQALTGFWGDSD